MPLTNDPQNPQQPTAPAQGGPEWVSREEFGKLQEQANNQSAILRKEREAAAKAQKELTERLEALAAKLEAPKPEPEPEPSKGGKSAAEKAAELAQAKYDARIKELEAKYQKAEAEKAETEARQKAAEERAALTAGLAALGVEGPKQKMALAYLYGEEKRVTRDDNGNIVFRVQRVAGKDRFDDLVSLEEGLKEWATTEEGKSVLPARGVQGSGTTPGRPARGDGKMTKVEAATILGQMLSRD